MKMERVVLNALASFQPDNCAFGESSGIVFRPGESSIGEADLRRCQT
jgi:hypothetical protein